MAPHPPATPAVDEIVRPRPGRPRDPQRHDAILAATRELILEGGYNRVSFEGVAQRAGVSRMTIRKWWSHRVELVEEALFPDYTALPAPDTGSFEGDLRALIDEVVERMTQPVLILGMPPLRAELNAHPELMKSTATRYGAPNERRWKDVFRRACARGEIARAADAVTAMLVVLGAIEALSQARPQVVPHKKMTPYLVALLLGGIAAPPAKLVRR